ncbi:hypothetical protein V1507DRAFT_73037 [Lipomyces tetrasporus]
MGVFFHHVQEQQTVDKYALIWCKILWLACLKVKNQGTMTLNLILSPEQAQSAQELVNALELIPDCHVDQDDESYLQSMARAVELSIHILRQNYGVVNKIDPDTGATKSSAYIIPRAINLLSLRPNGTFLGYLQITHITAAVRYTLRSIMLYRVMRVMTQEEQTDEPMVDREIELYLSPRLSTAFTYCVQVHAACRSYGSNHHLPTITWATDDFTALRLNSGTLFSLTTLKGFIKEMYQNAEVMFPELCLHLDVPTHFARSLQDVYSNSEPGYSFLSDSGNHLPAQHLSDTLLSEPNLRGKYVNVSSIIVGRAQSYLKTATKFLEILFLLMHVTYGSPARMTEVNSWKHVNSVNGMRNIYCHPRGQVILGLYNKTTSLTGKERFIVHLIPARLEKLFLTNLICKTAGKNIYRRYIQEQQ